MWGNTIPVATKVLQIFRLYSKKIVSKIFALNKTTRPQKLTKTSKLLKE